MTRNQAISAADSALKGQHAVRMLHLTERLLASRSSDVDDLRRIVQMQGEQNRALTATITTQGRMLDLLERDRKARQWTATKNTAILVVGSFLAGYLIGSL